jgi:aryl-alcohol dehydrogenase-like predicted oxidoreductase
MRYRRFANTGLYVSEICFGTMTFGGKGFWQAIGALGADDAEALVGASLDAGVNFIDTADVYSEGESETLLGGALASLGRPRDQIVIATKVRGRTGPGPNQNGLSRSHILASVDGSLRRLKLDFIDLYQIHGMDRQTPIEETLRALDDVVRAGKVRYVGFCNLPAWQAAQAVTLSTAHGLARFVSAQMYYSIAGRDIEREIVPLATDQHIAILPWSPLAGGLLSGKYEIDPSAPDAAEAKPASVVGHALPGTPTGATGPQEGRRTSFDFPPVDRNRARAVLAAMREVAAESGLSVARIALAWVLTRPFVTSVIIGAKTRDQLHDNLAASDVTLAPEHIAKLDAASALPIEYPGWMVDWQDRDRTPDHAR